MPEKRCVCGLVENLAVPAKGQLSYVHTCQCGRPFWVGQERALCLAPDAGTPEQQEMRAEFDRLMEEAESKRESLTWKLRTTHVAVLIQQLYIASGHPRNKGPVADLAATMRQELIKLLDSLAPGFQALMDRMYPPTPEDQQAPPEPEEPVESQPGPSLVVPRPQLILPPGY